MDIKNVDTFDLIEELKLRGVNTGLLFSRDDVDTQLKMVNDELDEDEQPIELTDDEKDDILESSIGSEYFCTIINQNIYDTIYNDYKE